MAVEAIAEKPRKQPEPKPVKEAEAPPRAKEIPIDLTTPVQAHGETVKKLVFRRPTGGDIMQMGEGYPIIIDWGTGRVTPHPKVMSDMMSVLASVPPSTIRQLDAEDWATCAYALMGFFPPGAQAMQS
jgi:Phage tail assembly chaperone proteins, E, or 41 or 14